MKAILIVDMPDNCAECQFCGFGGRDLEKYVCCLTREYSDDTHMVGCPLKPMPKKADIEKYRRDYYVLGDKSEVKTAIQYAMCKGYNGCIERILGETE